jgi:hypothetical protein
LEPLWQKPTNHHRLCCKELAADLFTQASYCLTK